MAVSDWVKQGPAEKQRVKIMTVDPATRRIEAMLKEGVMIQIAVWEIPSAFVWPRAEEFWTVYKDSGYWMLGSRMELDEENNYRVESLNAGEGKFGADVIYTPSGHRVLTTGGESTVVSVRDFGAKGDGTTDDTAAFIAGILAQYDVGGWLLIPRGTYVVSSSLAVTRNALNLLGEGPNASIIKYIGSSGYCLDVQASGKQHFEGFTIDGSSATGSARALRLGSGTSRNEIVRVMFTGFATSQYAVQLEGSLDNTLLLCDWENNSLHLRIRDNTGHTYPSNQNNFYSCKFQTATNTSGSGISVEDSEGNLFDGCLFQNNATKFTIAFSNNAGGNAPGRMNMLRACWFEENGNGTSGSQNVRIGGYDSSHKVEGTIVRDCKLLSSAHDHPSVQIYMINADATVIDGNYANLGTPNISVQEDTAVTRIRFGANDFYGDFNGTHIAGLAASVYWST